MRVLPRLGKVFLSGLAAVLPAVLTVALVVWLASGAEAFMGRGMRAVLPSGVYIPGMGLVAAVVLIFLIGLLLHAWLFRAVLDWAGRVLEHIPLVKVVYGGLRDAVSFLTRRRRGDFGRPVWVDWNDARLLGFVTHDDNGAQETVGVYLPMSYQIGGYFVFLPRRQVSEADMSVEEAMRFVLTAGMGVPGGKA